ncbi:MAG TPA: hypothetical protein VFD92_15065 [Candidatus Binatia bacterium]|nr:hypothetical protein [Candidatus Binatia bacterium]
MSGRGRKAGLVFALLCAFVIGCYAGPTIAYQPHMENALSALQSARRELEMAEPNKGGFREQAIGLVDQAISAVRQGMNAAS